MSCGAALSPELSSAPEARKVVTVVFCDVEGSTSLGGRLDPEPLRQVMVRFFGRMRAVLERNGGTVGKYIGDAVMAVFGIPRLNEDDALRAVRAADQMQRELDDLNLELEREFGVRLRVRIGVNTGEVAVGDEARGETLVLGDAVNVAARFEQAAPPGEVLIGAPTYALVRDHVTVEDSGPLTLKGKPDAIHAYRLVSVRPADPGRLGPEPNLIGRARELEILRGAFEGAAAERQTHLMTVLGPAGIGKSRLSREFVSALPPDALVLTAGCLPYGDGITFWPVAELVKRACGIADEDGRSEARSRLDARLAGAEDAVLVADRLSELVGVGEGTSALQETFWAIRKFLEWLGRDRPVVVVLDDLHWAEPTLLDLVEYLAGSTRDTALLVLCLARSELLENRPSWVGTAATLSLSALDEVETEALVASRLSDVGLGHAFVRRIAESSGGNPLFAEEMLRMLEDDGLLQRSGDEVVVVGDLAAVAVPASIQALLGARIDRLSEEERVVVRCAAVVGQEFWWGAVSELAPPPLRARVGSHLQALVRKDLIRPDASSFAREDGFRFHHQLVQEAAYLSTPKEARADLHARFAAWLWDAAGERSVEFEEVVGYHLEQAAQYRAELGGEAGELRSLRFRAASSLGNAGRRALERRDVSAAADLLRRASDLHPPDADERRFVLLELAEALLETGDLPIARTALDDAERASTSAGDQGLLARIAIRRLFVLESADPKRFSEEAEPAAERLISTLEELGDDVGLAKAWRLVGDVRSARSWYAGADEALARAIVHARRADDAREEADCLGRYIGSGTYGPAHVGEVERRCRELLASVDGSGGREAPAFRALAVVRAMQERFDEARGLAERARTTLEEYGFRLRASWVSETAGAIEMLAGDPRAAERELRRGFDATAEMGEQGFHATVAASLARALVAQGKLDEADRFASISQTAAADDDLASQVQWRSARARILAASGAAAAGEALAREALELVARTDDINMHADMLVDAAMVLVDVDRQKEVGDMLDEAIELFTRKGNDAAAAATRRRRAELSAS
jgi:class 3 adenylate cyclase/tetratricopeptide (TPR) repeat protein